MAAFGLLSPGRLNSCLYGSRLHCGVGLSGAVARGGGVEDGGSRLSRLSLRSVDGLRPRPKVVGVFGHSKANDGDLNQLSHREGKDWSRGRRVPV